MVIGLGGYVSPKSVPGGVVTQTETAVMTVTLVMGLSTGGTPTFIDQASLFESTITVDDEIQQLAPGAGLRVLARLHEARER